MTEYIEELQQSPNGSGGKFGEVGTLGLEAWTGFISMAYESSLEWPAVFPIYNRIRRSDSAIGGIIRPAFVNMARRTDYRVVTDVDAKKQTDTDKRAVEFLEQVLDDIAGGFNSVMESWVSYAPFMGWLWQEEVYAIRRPDWKPPGKDEWRSKYDDGLVGLRRLAHRDHSSFYEWDMDDATGRVMGLKQLDLPNPPVIIPRNKSLHITFGDDDNPEGLSPLEAVYRVERRMRAYELVHGIGSEHSAGHLKFKKMIGGDLTSTDKTVVETMARKILSAHQGNYMALPEGLDGDVMSVPFEAAGGILDMIRFLYLVELQIYSMQFVAIATTAGLGSQTAIEDSRAQALDSYNGMIAGFVRQFNDQTVQRLFRNPVNAAAFPGLERLPYVEAVPIERSVPLSELATFITAIAPVAPLGDDDWKAIRQRSGFLPEEMPKFDNQDGGDSVATDQGAAASPLTEKQVLNGAQIASAIQIIQAFSDGVFERENAVFMIQTFFNLPKDIAEGLVPGAGGPRLTPSPKSKPAPSDSPPDSGMTDEQIAKKTQEMIQWAIDNDPDFAELWNGQEDV